MLRMLAASRPPSSRATSAVVNTADNGAQLSWPFQPLKTTARSCTPTTRNDAQHSAIKMACTCGLRHAHHTVCRQLAKKIVAQPSANSLDAPSSCARGTSTMMAMDSAAHPHRARSILGTCCCENRKVNMQKHSTYATMAATFSRDMRSELSNGPPPSAMMGQIGHGAVASSVLVYSVHANDISANQP
ncbi:hypothetical protein SDC9_197061 [bioreactor metagenome]|uniref:Uncharacterized protein n=1 Tax=bioreactor metagenome TaxID=1076179 RepID=A0A645IE92_9ZZZZ